MLSHLSTYPAPKDVTISAESRWLAGARSKVTGNVIERDYNAEPTSVNATGDDAPTVLILTPVKNAAKHIPKYFDRLSQLTYPKHRISLGFLTSDSNDGTHELMTKMAKKVAHQYRHVSILKKDFHYQLDNNARHGWEAQIPRRKIMSMSRNFLLTSSLKDEEWVVWWDVDVNKIPNTIIEDLMKWDKDVIQPNCYYKLDNGQDYPYDLNSWKETNASLEFQKDKKDDEIFFEGYPDVMWTRRIYLNDYRHRDMEIIELDGVGGTFLLVRADVHRAGANFPAFPVKHQLETEGFAKMAKLMGFGIYGLPHYIIYHG
jgi:hypothetical protein